MSDKPKLPIVGQYLKSQGGAKYIKIERRKSKNGNDSNEPIVIAEGDVLFVNIFDEDFRAKYNIKDFVIGSVSLKKAGDGDKGNGNPDF